MILSRSDSQKEESVKMKHMEKLTRAIHLVSNNNKMIGFSFELKHF